MGTTHVLVVDRDLPFRAALRRFLSSRGHAVTEAETMAEAVDVLRRETVSLVLIELAGLDPALVALIRFLQDAGTVPILFVTATAQDRLPAELRSRAAGIFIKSRASLGELGDAVDRVLGGS